MQSCKKEIKTYRNFGVQILRLFLCFWVVVDHCLSYHIKMQYYSIFKNNLHVPCFIVISFFFSYDTIRGRNISKVKKRFERLLIPYFVLPIIILVINNLSFVSFNISFFGNIITLRDLFVQYIIGRKIIYVFWFQFFLIWTTLLFVIISFAAKKRYLLIIEHIYILSYLLRYSNLNYQFFIQYSLIIQNSVGQFLEVMPMSVSGSIIASSNIFKIIQLYNKKVIYLSAIALIFIIKYNIFSDINLFAFGGMILDICSVLLFFIFYLFPLNNIKSPYIKKLINLITNNTQGIYSIHQLVRMALLSKVDQIKNGSFSGCVLIYIFSYFISFIGEKLTKRTKLS